MSVTQYTIPCRYNIPKLKDTVYFVSKSMAKIVNIDNGTASVTINNPSPYPMSPSKLQGFNIRLNETESLDERYKFTKALNISIFGHLTDSRFLMDDDYFLVVEDYNGNFYLINVDFPSKMTYTYTLAEGQNQTDFTFTSNSNFPLLKLNWNIAKWDNCKVYTYNGIRNLKLIEKGWAKVDVENDSITLYDNHTFKDVDFNKASCTLTESYDGDNITNTITFDIPFDNSQSSWQYNLLEFNQNLYIAEILPKNSEHALLVGFENGLQPSYNAVGGTSNGDASKFTITLEETSQMGLEELIDWSVYEDTNKKWVYVRQIDHKNAFTCIGHGLARYDYMVETDQDGNELGNYKRFSGATAESFPYLNVVGTFNDEVTFQSPVCNCSDEDVYKFNGNYYCVDGDKVEALEGGHTFDCGKSIKSNGIYSDVSDYTIVGNIVERDSDFCDDDVQYMWVLKRDKSECVEFEDRWVVSGYTCGGDSGFDKYLVEKQQIWDATEGWIDTDPLVTRESLVEKDSEDCGYVELKYRFVLNDSSVVTGECSTTGSNVITRSEVPQSVVSAYIGDCVTEIGQEAFCGCTSLSSVTLGANVTRINPAAFYRCTGLTNINLPDGLTFIGNSAFGNCSGLTSLTIPATVKTVGTTSYTPYGGRPFDGCISLESITFLSTTPPFLVMGGLGNTNDCMVYVPCESVDTYKTYKGNTGAPSYALYDWTMYALRIQGIPPCELPPTPSQIKYTMITRNSDTMIQACDGTNRITEKESSAYTAVVSLEIGNCVSTIDGLAFRNCQSFTSITIGNNVTTIGSVFTGCTALTTVSIPAATTSIGYQAFKDTPWWAAYSADTSHQYGNIVYINNVAHKAVSQSITSCTFSPNTVSISEDAFYRCSGLTDINLPDGISEIKNSTFYGCSGLTSVTIPANIRKIGSKAFAYCSSLASLTVNRTTPPTLANWDAFQYTSSNFKIYVPASSVNAYKSASGWSDWDNIIYAIP